MGMNTPTFQVPDQMQGEAAFSWKVLLLVLPILLPIPEQIAKLKFAHSGHLSDRYFHPIVKILREVPLRYLIFSRSRHSARWWSLPTVLQ